MLIRHLSGVRGGAERIVAHLANTLSRAGHRVSVLHWDDADGPPWFPLDPAVRRTNLHPGPGDPGLALLRTVARRAPYWRLRHRLTWEAANGPFRDAIARWFRANRPDVAIGFMPPANTPALLAGRRTGTPVIASNRNDPVQDYTNPARWDPSERDRRLRLALLEHAAAVHVLLPDFVPFFPPSVRARTFAIPNPLTPGIERFVGQVPRRPVIAASGRLHPAKDFATLIEAWALLADRHRDWCVEIHGEGDERPRLEALIARHGLGGRCRLVGWTADLAPALAAASLFCHPALFEGFGNSAAEALACGLPVVAFADCTGLDAYLRHEVNGLTVPRDEGAAGLAAALDRLIVDGALRRRLAEAAPGSVAAFSQEAFAQRWLSVIDRVARGLPPLADAEPRLAA
ncbi:MAG: glycosyltransferase [Acetobacteraceae bacterium]